MLKAIIFDYGKVLTLPPTSADWAKLAGVFGATVERLQKPYWSLREDYDRGVYNASSYWLAVGEHLFKMISKKDIDRLVEYDNAQWTKENPEMLDFAWRAKAAGLKIGILSNMQSDMLAAMRRKLDWLGRFDVQAYSCEIGAIKPEAASYQYILKGLVVNPDESLFFDDKEANIDGARALGMHAQLYEDEIQAAYRAADRLGIVLAAQKSAN
jgi:putative hydrolase of the HAD superfamily